MNKNILVVSQAKVGLTETFIQAHIDHLKGNIFHLYGYYIDYKTNKDQSLQDLYTPKKGIFSRLKSILPYFIYFRIQQKQKVKYTPEAYLIRYLKDNKIDVVLAEYGTTGSFIAPVCAKLNIPLIVHFHGHDASRYRILEQFKTGYSFMFQYAKNIIAVSNAMKQALMQQGCPEKKIALNTYGPHSDYFNITPDYNSNTIISVGRHTYKKAPYLTILAFQKVLQHYPDIKLVMIGNGELFEVSKNMVKSLGLENNISLLGGLERKDIISEMQNAFLYVQHSLIAGDGDSEGTPVGIIEAMAAGLPIVSTRHAGIPDVVIEGETGYLVSEGDIDGMAENIIDLMQDRKRAKLFGENACQKIATQFSIKKHIDTLNQLIY